MRRVIALSEKPKIIDMEEAQIDDIIITKYEKQITYDEEGNKIEKRIPIKVNITRKVNESAKLIKEYKAEEKLAEIEKIFSK
jgi:hypothetical protein